jgi:hypothetical protein
VHALLTRDVVDAMSILSVPVVLGSGKKLFAAGSAREADNGVAGGEEIGTDGGANVAGGAGDKETHGRLPFDVRDIDW